MTAPHHYTLEIQYVNRPPETRRIEARRVVIGRDAGDIVLNDTQASAAHAEIEFENGQVVVRDLGSTNGTWLGQRQLPQFALSPGHGFRCGHTHIRLLEIAGGQQLRAGRTVMADASQMPAMAPPGAPPSSGPVGHAPGPMPASVAAARPAGPGPGAIAAAVVGGVVLLGAIGTGAWFLLRGGAEDEVAEVETPEPEVEPEPQPEVDPEPIAPEDPDLSSLYQKVGAATVVVRVPGSVGSGAVIDPSGVILTNHHVIDGGVREGLSLKAKVVFGEYDEDMRTFEPRHEQVDAWVIKIDKDHDLALLRLVDPPAAALTHITVAPQNPHTGQRVAAIGHAGVGMLWAIKSGEISATGSLSGHTDLLLDANEGDREYLEETKKRFEKMGRVIQSTAKILPGDSGGPLVNLASEIVGVNAFGRIDRATNQWLSFHIHRAEVADFVAEIPARPLAVVPDPLDHAGEWSRVEDANLDGKADVLLISGRTGSDSFTHWGTLIDLDADSFATAEHGASPSAVNDRIAEVVEDRAFDAEFAVLHEPGGASHYWYDRDGVGGFDLYLLDEYGLGKPAKAWSLDADGGADELDALELGNGLRAELFTAPAMQAAFRTIGAAVFPGQIEAGASDSLPLPEHELDGAVALRDGNGDQLNDTIVESSAFDTRTFFDLDQNSIGRTTGVEALKVLLEVATVDAELAMITQGVNAWVWYDRDDDGRFDLVLRTHDLGSGIAHEAFTVSDPSATPVPAPEHVGRLLLRPPLLSKADLAQRLADNDASSWSAAATSDGLASFPSLARSEFASVMVDGQTALVTDLGYDLTLIDVDGDSSGGAAQATAASVRSGAFDAEFVLLRRGGVEWAFYDRDGSGDLDWVMISVDDDGGNVTHVYEIGATSATLRPTVSGTALINAATFTNPQLRDAFTTLARTQFPDRAR